MLSIAICDDEYGAAKRLQEMTEECCNGRETQIQCFSDRASLIRELQHDYHPDIVLMDILLQDGNGIDIARELFPGGSATQVIFVTGYLEYASDVYETEHVYFLHKPVKMDILRRAIDKAERKLNEQGEKMLTIQINRQIRRIPCSQIFCIEHCIRKVILHCEKEKIEYYDTLSSLSQKLPGTFLRCHKGYFVNLDYVSRLETDFFTLTDGSKVPISRTRRSAVKKTFMDYMNQE